MKLFKPSRKILEMICGKKRPAIVYEIYPNPHDKFNQKNHPYLFISSLNARLCEFYKINLNDETRSRLDLQEIFEVTGEILKNCFDHGPKNKDLWFGLFLGNEGVCYGFCDGGGYFKNDKIKYQYENKIPITEFDKRTLEFCCQQGVNEYIYPCSDMIEVDSKKGILYCVQLKKNIIAPEGENGSSYFYNLKKKGKIID